MKIGIFWYWNNQVIGIAHSFNITKADSIGLIDSPYTHIEYWITLQEKYSELQNYEYEQIPRGRVIFDTNKEKSIIYLDKTLLYKSKINKVYDFFNLNPEQSVLKKDSHYQIWPTLLLDQQTCVKIHTGLDDLMVDIVESQEDHELLAKLVAGFLYELSII